MTSVDKLNKIKMLMKDTVSMPHWMVEVRKKFLFMLDPTIPHIFLHALKRIFLQIFNKYFFWYHSISITIIRIDKCVHLKSYFTLSYIAEVLGMVDIAEISNTIVTVQLGLSLVSVTRGQSDPQVHIPGKGGKERREKVLRFLRWGKQ